MLWMGASEIPKHVYFEGSTLDVGHLQPLAGFLDAAWAVPAPELKYFSWPIIIIMAPDIY